MALPGGGAAAVELANCRDGAVKAYWCGRAQRAAVIVQNHESHQAAAILGGG
jgi:hypothetical protein